MKSEALPEARREEFARLVLRLRAKGIHDFRIYSALEQIPRRFFIQPQWADCAYENGVFPLECGQFLESLDEQVCLLAALALERGHRVLEIGTGSGFTTALLACLSGRVTTVDRYRVLVDNARQRFQSLRLTNIILRHGDALTCLQDSGPFDRIIIWPAMQEEPRQFFELLANNGVMLAAVGAGMTQQTVIRYAKNGDNCSSEDICHVRYQPILSGMAKSL